MGVQSIDDISQQLAALIRAIMGHTDIYSGPHYAKPPTGGALHGFVQRAIGDLMGKLDEHQLAVIANAQHEHPGPIRRPIEGGRV